MSEIVVTCPVCALEVAATPAGSGLVVACHHIPGTRFPCPEGGTMVTAGVKSWRGRRPPGPPMMRPLVTRGHHGDDLVTCRAWKRPVAACHDAVMLPYASYLRVYEPVSAFPEPEARRWLAYATSADRPRRAEALAVEQAESLRRLIATPPLPAPECESGDAYVRWSEGVTYICPWQTRLRSWLALARLRATAPSLARAAFPGGGGDAAAHDFARWQGQDPPLRVYIQASTWSIPFAWFVPFVADERWLVLGTPGDPGDGGRATVSGTRTLVYTTAMTVARQRVAWALRVIRRGEGGQSRRVLDGGSAAVATGLAEIGTWLKEFHPQALVELDYGGLVHLFDDGALCADQSVAEASASISALAGGEAEFAAAMYRRFTRRWQAQEALGRGC